MGGKKEEVAWVSQAEGSESCNRTRHSALRPRYRRPLVVTTAALLLLVVCAGALHYLMTRTSSPAQAVARSITAPSPPFSSAEEAYVRALWPIHGDVERSAVRMSLGTIFYKTGDIERMDLKRRLDTALVAYQKAEVRIGELDPPPSLARAQQDYLAAIRLYEQATVEALKMFSDGDEEHLVIAHPLSHEGSNRIREIGGRFWRDEFPPN